MRWNVCKDQVVARCTESLNFASECVGHTIKQLHCQVRKFFPPISKSHLDNFGKFTSFCRHRALSQYSSTSVHYTANQQIPNCLHLAPLLQRFVFAFDCSIAPSPATICEYWVYTVNPYSEGLVALKYCLDQRNVKERILETLLRLTKLVLRLWCDETFIRIRLLYWYLNFCFETAYKKVGIVVTRLGTCRKTVVAKEAF